MKRTMHKKRIALATILFAFVVTFGTPHVSYAQAWGEAITSQILKQSLEKVAKAFADIQKATITSILMVAISTQIDSMIENAGGRITDWRDYMDVRDVAKENVLAKTTRTGNLSQDVGDDPDGDSITRRSTAFVNAALAEDVGSGVSPTDFARGSIGTVDKDTGKINIENIGGFTAIFSDAKGGSTYAAKQATEDALNDEESELRDIQELQQIAAGFDSKNAQQVKGLVEGLRNQVAKIGFETATESLITKSIAGTAVTSFMNKAGSFANSSAVKARKSVEKSLKEYYVNNGGSEEFGKIY